MSVHRLHRTGRIIASGTILALLVLVMCATTVAAHTVTHLSLAAVSPRTATTANDIAFSVVFTDRYGNAPKSVTVVIDAAGHAMTKSAGSFATGAVYTYKSKLPKGKHDVVFTSTDARGEKESVGAGSVWISATTGGGDPSSGSIGGDFTPAPTVKAPAPTAVVTPPPTKNPAPVVTSSPAPTAPPAQAPVDPASKPTASNPGVVLPNPTAQAPVDPGTPSQPTDRPAAAPTPAFVNPGAGQDVATKSSEPEPQLPVAAETPKASAVAVTGVSKGGSGGGSSEVAAATTTGTSSANGASDIRLRRQLPMPELVAALAPSIATSTAGATAWAAFVIFGKRRRDGGQPASDEVLATAAATGLEPAATQTVVPGVDESLLPRWRRPSLQAARKTDPLRMVAETPHLTFDASPVLPLDGYERRQVRYRLVRLLDSPDELFSTEIGLLDQGDEVQLVERHGAYWRVLCPDGRQGWLHRMTLADPVALPDAHADYSAPSDTAEIGPDDILDAYLRARRQDGSVD